MPLIYGLTFPGLKRQVLNVVSAETLTTSLGIDGARSFFVFL
jgi:hypothetical protein